MRKAVKVCGPLKSPQSTTFEYDSSFSEYAAVATYHERSVPLKKPRYKNISTRLGSLRLAVSAALTCTMLTASGATAQAADVYLSGAERINAGDHIRSLSQHIAVASCFVDAGIKTEQFRSVMTDSIAEYEILFAALQDGNDDYGINRAEDDRKMLVALRASSVVWGPFQTAAQERLDGSDTTTGTDYISRQNLNVMHSGKYLISEVVNHYSIPPALLISDAFTLDIVARQRTLSYQIAKEACGVATGNTVMGNQQRLEKSTSRFNASFEALLNGFAGAGVSPPPTPEIKTALEEIKEDWATLKPEIDQISSDTDVNSVFEIYTKLDTISDRFDALVPLYIEDSKSGI